MGRNVTFDDAELKKLNGIYYADSYGSDAAAIQSAIDDIAAAGGGLVWAGRESGPWPLDSTVLNIKDNVHLRSDGAELTAGTKDVAGGDTLAIQNDDQTNGNDDWSIEGFEITGKISTSADTGNYSSNVSISDVSCVGVPDFAFDLDNVNRALVADCYASNQNVGTDNNGNDGVHVTDSKDTRIENFQGDTGDDIVAIEAESQACTEITVVNPSGSSTVGDLVKGYTNPNTTAGDDIHSCRIEGGWTDGTVNSPVEFENDGSGEIYDWGITGLRVTNAQRAILTNDYTNTHDITLVDNVIRSAQRSILDLGKNWESYGGRYIDGGNDGANYQAVTLVGDGAKVIGGVVGPTTNHAIFISANNCTVRDVYIDATDGTAQGVRVNGTDNYVGGNVIDAVNDWAIGSTGTDAGTRVENNTLLSNGIGHGQFSSDALIGPGMIGNVGYKPGDYVPLTYGSGSNTSDNETSSSTYSTAENAADGIISWDLIEPSNGDAYCWFYGRVDLLNGSTMDVRIRNVTDGETMCERTGISSTGPFSISPTAYTPTTTGPIHYQAEIASTDNTNTVRLDDGAAVFGVQL